MDDSGFDWLNLQPPRDISNVNSYNNSRDTSPAPQVSFGNFSDLTLNQSHQPSSNSTASTRHLSVGATQNPMNYSHSNSLADNVLTPNSISARMASSNHSYSSIDQSNIDESSIPLSLTAQELTLQESRTYIRWYSDILARTNSRTISMNDVYNFLNNFKLSPELKEGLNKLFHKILNSINIGEFFALLRVISHCLNGKTPSRRLIKIDAPIPTPPSILSKKRQNDYDDEEEEHSQELESSGGDPNEKEPLDLDSFTQFMLTGQRPDEKPRKRKKKMKSVKFSDQIVTDIHDDTFQSLSPVPSPQNELDLSLPMDQLLSRMNPNQPQNPKSKPDEEEQEILKDMGSQLNHFRNLNSVDTASIGGVPASIHLNHGSNNSTDQLLRPNMTGPAQMSYLQQHHQPQEPRQPQDTLKPNVTGPYDMMKMFSPSPDEVPPQQNQQSQQNQQNQEMPKISLQSFTNQMTGNTASNTMANSQPTPPPPVPASRRNRSMSSPTPHSEHPPPPPISRARSPNMPSSTSNGKPPPPPPPPSRRRGASGSGLYGSSSPQPPTLPPKIPNEQNQNNGMYSTDSNDSTTNILDDLKQLQAEVDRIRDMTGGF